MRKDVILDNYCLISTQAGKNLITFNSSKDGVSANEIVNLQGRRGDIEVRELDPLASGGKLNYFGVAIVEKTLIILSGGTLYTADGNTWYVIDGVRALDLDSNCWLPK